MKHFFTILVTLLLLNTTYSQVGINTEQPRALLDIKAENEDALTNTTGVMVSEDGLLIPRVSTLLVNGSQPIEGLIVYLTATFTNTTPDPDVIYEPGFYVSQEGEWTTFGDGPGESLGQLRLVDEGNGNGYRLNGVDPANYGDIGVFSKDFSLQLDASSTRGATGTASFVAGINTTASGVNSLAFGAESIASGLNTAAFGFSTIASGQTSMAVGDDTEAKASGSMAVGISNTDYTVNDDGTDRLFIVGNGVSRGARSDAFIVQKNGTITAPSFSNAEITAAGNKALITKEYFDANANINTGLKRVTENSVTGYRLANANAANFANTGLNAITLSFYDGSNATRGATGNSSLTTGIGSLASATASLATGVSTIASGDGASSFGSNTVASGNRSFSMGVLTTAQGEAAVTMGRGTTAKSKNELVVGTYNTDYTVNDDDTDRAFGIGNGISSSRSDALIVLKNGTITAPSLSVAEIDTAGNSALTTKEFTDENYIGRLPSGNTAARPATAPQFGTMRYNTQTGRPEVYVENSTDVAEGNTYVPGWVRL